MSGAGRGAKFKKYYEPSPVGSITSNIVTHVGTGHRLANLAVAPILPPERRDRAGLLSVGEFLAVERMRGEVRAVEATPEVVENPVRLEISEVVELPAVNIKLPLGFGNVEKELVDTLSGRKIVGEKRAASVETDDPDNISVDSTAEVLEDHYEFGCDEYSDSSEEEEKDGLKLVKMLGVMNVGVEEGDKRAFGRGRGRPRYKPVTS